MSFTGIPNTENWAGYDYLQWTGDTYHPGLDYNYGVGEEDKGKPVLCVGNGFVEKIIRWDGVTKGFGNNVFIKHTLEDDSVVYSHYCHLDSVTCKEGQDIDKGNEIGKCGGSGGWPSHLHIEIRPPLGKGYDFWPKGYSKDWVAGHYFDPYGFIEKRKENTLNNNMSIDSDTFSKLVHNSDQWDQTVKYVEISTDPKDTQFTDVQKVIAGFKGRITDLQTQLSTAQTELKNKDTELENKAKAYQTVIELKDGHIKALETDIQTLRDLQKQYEDKIKELQGIVNNRQEEMGKLQTELNNLKVKLDNLTSSLTFSELIALLLKRLTRQN